MFGTPLRRFTRDSANETQELRRDRARNNHKLKSKFERIFEKYGKDFQGVGDEIDLTTGRLVVDNGHLSRMQHERDLGSTPSRRFVRAFTQELGGEDHQESRALDELRYQSRIHSQSGHRSPLTTHRTPTRERPSHLHSREGREKTSTHPVPPYSAANKQSALMTMAQPTEISQGVNPDAIQSLGNALASQIANFLNQQLISQINPVSHNAWAVPPLPHHVESHYTPVADSRSVSLQSPTPTPGMSLWAPHAHEYDDYHDNNAHARYTYADSIPLDDPDLAMESVERANVFVEDRLAYGAGRPSAYHFMHGTQRFDHFLDQANYTFQTLAHGFANRGCLTEKENRRSTRIARGRHLKGANARIYTEAREESVNDRSSLRGHAFTVQEDRTILRLKKQNFSSSEIARYLPGRSSGSIAVRYSRALKPGSDRWKEERIVELADDYDESLLPDDDEEILNPNEADATDTPHDPLQNHEQEANSASIGKRKRDHDLDVIDFDAGQPPQPQTLPEKRKRGRPRKHPRPESMTSTTSGLRREMQEPNGSTLAPFYMALGTESRTGSTHKLQAPQQRAFAVAESEAQRKPRKPVRKQGFVNFDAASFAASMVGGNRNKISKPAVEALEDMSGRYGQFSHVHVTRERDTSTRHRPHVNDLSGFSTGFGPRSTVNGDEDERTGSASPPSRPVHSRFSTDDEDSQQDFEEEEEKDENYFPIDPQLLEATYGEIVPPAKADNANAIRRLASSPRAPIKSTQSVKSTRSPLPATPINRTLLSPHRSKTGRSNQSLRSSMFRQNVSSPARERGVSMASATSHSEYGSGTSASIEASDDDL
ncbi:hypothetical protein ANO11243_006730 [Dothideomycetidae sp. 11243]|nr:hypothetical protein ANO11243_006730 [fungal sp. No.11243]